MRRLKKELVKPRTGEKIRKKGTPTYKSRTKWEIPAYSSPVFINKAYPESMSGARFRPVTPSAFSVATCVCLARLRVSPLSAEEFHTRSWMVRTIRAV